MASKMKGGKGASMRLSSEQELAVESGQPIRVRNEGLDYVVIRADLYDRVAALFEIDNPLMQVWRPSVDVGDSAPTTRTGPGRELTERWTTAENHRRCDLIDKEIQGTITETERRDLERLQRRFHEHLDRVAPPPIEGAVRLHQQLLDKKRQRERLG